MLKLQTPTSNSFLFINTFALRNTALHLKLYETFFDMKQSQTSKSSKISHLDGNEAVLRPLFIILVLSINFHGSYAMTLGSGFIETRGGGTLLGIWNVSELTKMKKIQSRNELVKF